MDKKAIGNAVTAMRLAADYLEVLEKNDGLLKAKNALIAEKRSLVERNKRLHVERMAVSAELEAVSKDRFQLQGQVDKTITAQGRQLVAKDGEIEQLQRRLDGLVADDPDFEVADAPADEKEMGPLPEIPDLSRVVFDAAGGDVQTLKSEAKNCDG